VAGVVGVIYDLEENKIVEYSWGLGKETNNKVEILTVYMGLNLFRERNIQTLIVLGDFEIVIKEIIGINR
jgi:ribonuclease HI